MVELVFELEVDTGFVDFRVNEDGLINITVYHSSSELLSPRTASEATNNRKVLTAERDPDSNSASGVVGDVDERLYVNH